MLPNIDDLKHFQSPSGFEKALNYQRQEAPPIFVFPENWFPKHSKIKKSDPHRDFKTFCL